MNCSDCNGACCRVIFLLLARSKKERELAKKRGAVLVGYDYLYAFPSVCPFLDAETGRCKDYENRPQACKDYPPGCHDCLLARKAAGLK